MKSTENNKLIRLYTEYLHTFSFRKSLYWNFNIFYLLSVKSNNFFSSISNFIRNSFFGGRFPKSYSFFTENVFQNRFSAAAVDISRSKFREKNHQKQPNIWVKFHVLVGVGNALKQKSREKVTT